MMQNTSGSGSPYSQYNIAIHNNNSNNDPRELA